jgi:hypothetical protein
MIAVWAPVVPPHPDPSSLCPMNAAVARAAGETCLGEMPHAREVAMRTFGRALTDAEPELPFYSRPLEALS